MASEEGRGGQRKRRVLVVDDDTAARGVTARVLSRMSCEGGNPVGVEKAKILVVDDQQALRDSVSRALERLGHKCWTAADGAEALELASKRVFDLVITDLQMPKMDGLSLIERLRLGRPEIPIIIMTGYGDLESARKALRLRISDYLVKPFEGLSEVQAAVQRALSTRSERADAETLVRELEHRTRKFESREQDLTASLERAKVEADVLARRLERSDAVASRQIDQIKAMLEDLQNGILVTDTRGAILSMNRELRRQLQVGNLGGIGASVDRMPGDSTLRDAILESRKHLLVGAEEPVFVAVDSELPNGSERSCMYEVRSARLAGQDGAPVGVLTTVRPTRRRPVKSGAGAEKNSGPSSRKPVES